MNEYEIRELCEAFFDAYQDGRVDVLDRLYADDCIVWHNVFGRETTRDENLARYPDSYPRASAGAPTTTASSTPSTTASSSSTRSTA